MTQTDTSERIIPLGSCFETWLRIASVPADPFEGITGLTNEGRPDKGEFPKHYRQNGEIQ